MKNLALLRLLPPMDGWYLRTTTSQLALALAVVGSVVPAYSQSQYDYNREPSMVLRNSFGEAGMLEMPSGRMADDGQFGANISYVDIYQRYTIWFQALPWLEAEFRYSRAPYWGASKVYYDRSFGAKLRLMNEKDGLADVSFGVRDLLGTGIYSGEYLVASRQVGDFDLTAGVGWGRFGSTGLLANPLGALFDSFKSRAQAGSEGTGSFSTHTLLHGENVGIFGGVVWQTPIDSLRLIAEYSSDTYKSESQWEGSLKVRTPVNVGLSYKVADTAALTAGWFYGTTYGVTLTLSADPATEYPSAVRIGPSVIPPSIRSVSEQQSGLQALSVYRRHGRAAPEQHSPDDPTRFEILQILHSSTRGIRDVDIHGNDLMIDANVTGDRAALCETYAQIVSATQTRIRTLALSDLNDPQGLVTLCAVKTSSATALNLSIRSGRPAGSTPEFDRAFNAAIAGQSLQLDAMWISGAEIWVYYENYYYRDEAEAIGRITRVLMASAPSAVELFHIVPVKLGVPQRQINISRSTIERSLTLRAPQMALSEGLSIRPGPMADTTFREQISHLYPSLTWSLDPKLSEHLFDPDAPIQFMVYGDAAALLQLAPGLMLATELTGTIWSNYTFTRPSDSVLPHVRTDLLDYIKHGKYGVSALQLIYRDRLAPNVFTEVRAGYLEDMFMGAGGQVLWRPERSRFAFGADLYQVWQRDYNRLFGHRNYQTITGHVSAYYQSPWYDLNFAVHAGRYLAGDRGATFQITRRFTSGVEIGAWATFTNVSKAQFGEGGFDKGIIIHIPFEWGLPINSQSAYDVHMSSLTRDGGARLAGDDSLYETTRQASYGSIIEHEHNVLEP